MQISWVFTYTSNFCMHILFLLALENICILKYVKFSDESGNNSIFSNFA